MDGRGGENYGDLGNRRIDEEDDEREGEDEDSDEDQADNGDEQQYDGYPMQFNDRDSTIQDTQIRNGRWNITRAPDMPKDDYMKSSNRTNGNSLG